MTSELYRSTFGDERLFFQHETITRDMNILQKQGDEGAERAHEWKQMMKDNEQKHTTGKFTDEEIKKMLKKNPLPEDNGEAMEIIEEGMLGEHMCPFAWLLSLV